MEYRPKYENKEIAARVAATIYSQRSSASIEAAIDKLGFTVSDNNGNIPSVVTETPGTHIGIWKEEWVNGEKHFVRDPAMADQFTYWSRTHEILPASGKFRIVLLGESVARGFLVDPAYNPAMALDKILQQSGMAAEVIDLARTNCSISQLTELAEKSVQLEPDALVVFAGNNWVINSQNSITSGEMAAIINVIIENNYTGAIREMIENKLSAEMNRLFDCLQTVQEKQHIPVFFVNPEFNLKDWSSNDIERIPLFSTKNIDEWYSLLNKAQETIAQQDNAAAESVAEAMIKSFPTNPAGFELMASCKWQQGKRQEALQFYRLANDTRIYQTSHCPGTTSFIRDYIRKESGKRNFHLVDLPELFEWEQVPDKTMFLDYCHLTVEGINMAMYQVAKAITAVATGKEISLSQTALSAMGPENASKAIAHFLAAIHNAHWGQNEAVIHYHCAKALSFHDISNEMLLYAFTTTSISCPWRLNKYFESLVASGMFMEYLLLSQPEEGLETFDFTLVEAIVTSLAEYGFEVEEELRAMRLKEYAGNNKKVDLLQSQYWLDYNYNLSVKLKKSSYFRELSNASKFYLLCKEKCAVKLELVCRLPYSTGADEKLEMEINGKPFFKTIINNRWNKSEIIIPGEMLQVGTNRLVLHWPVKNITSPYNTCVAFADIDLYHRYMYPVVGEIHSFTMSSVLVSATSSENESLPGMQHPNQSRKTVGGNVPV